MSESRTEQPHLSERIIEQLSQDKRLPADLRLRAIAHAGLGQRHTADGLVDEAVFAGLFYPDKLPAWASPDTEPPNLVQTPRFGSLKKTQMYYELQHLQQTYNARTPDRYHLWNGRHSADNGVSSRLLSLTRRTWAQLLPAVDPLFAAQVEQRANEVRSRDPYAGVKNLRAHITSSVAFREVALEKIAEDEDHLKCVLRGLGATAQLGIQTMLYDHGSLGFFKEAEQFTDRIDNMYAS